MTVGRLTPKPARAPGGREPAGESSLRRILIATDGSPAARKAVAAGLELAAGHGGDVTFLHVVSSDESDGAGEGAGLHGAEVEEADFVLREAAAAADAAGVSYALERVPGRASDEIVAVAAAKNVGLIVVGSRGRRTVSSAVLGSVSTGVLRKAGCPVLVVKDV